MKAGMLVQTESGREGEAEACRQRELEAGRHA
jgi:hypothetical protein